jgi:hypothetical protein
MFAVEYSYIEEELEKCQVESEPHIYDLKFFPAPESKNLQCPISNVQSIF